MSCKFFPEGIYYIEKKNDRFVYQSLPLWGRWHGKAVPEGENCLSPSQPARLTAPSSEGAFRTLNDHLQGFEVLSWKHGLKHILQS